MSSSDASPLVVTQTKSVTVVRLDQPLILTGSRAQAVADHLDQLAGAGQGKLVFNCANVLCLTSLLIGRLTELCKRFNAAGGSLALCDLQPDVREILELVGLTKFLRIYPTEQEALDVLGR
jgi:anti-anti-sigma factor